MIKDMVDRVIPDVMNDLLIPQGSMPENFLFLSLLEVHQEGGSFMEVLGGH